MLARRSARPAHARRAPALRGRAGGSGAAAGARRQRRLDRARRAVHRLLHRRPQRRRQRRHRGVQNGRAVAAATAAGCASGRSCPSLILLQLVDSTGRHGRSERRRRPAAGGVGTHRPLDLEDELAALHVALARRRGLPRLASLAGAPAKAHPDDQGRQRPAAEGRALRQGRLHALGVHDRVGWQSDPIGPVSFMAPPSATQACTDAPAGDVRRAEAEEEGQARSRRRSGASRCASWPTAWAPRTSCSRARRSIVAASTSRSAAARRNVTVTLQIPKKLRKAGKFLVTVTGSAPLGKARSKSTLILEVKK